MKMPIGCYKGQSVASLPTKYLAWLISQDAIRFKRWPLVKEAMRVLRARFESFEVLVAELQVDTPPPEYWKTAKRAGQKKAEQAEKLRALEERRENEHQQRRQAAKARRETQAPPAEASAGVLDASYYVRQARQQKPVDPNDVSDLL
ncbi:MAG TPA: DUF3820 family protein [Ottowia sp.]|uniref:putative quorum-sensing-regulated virulence factor n=1 Tax=Ottowia sp. TaxID=1898956 RepID=UPI002D04270F|nr:DUF3820 family protein [Ottowia sp.]HMN22287.1 DUF3820 family protein [Ottowia sp.]